MNAPQLPSRPRFHVRTELRDEDDFAGGTWRHDFFVRAGCLGQRDFFADDGPQSAIFEACTNAGVNFGALSIRDRPESKSSNGSATEHQVPRVDGHFAAAADDDDAAERTQQLEVVTEIHIGKHFQDDIDALPAGGFEHLVLVASLAMIESMM